MNFNLEFLKKNLFQVFIGLMILVALMGKSAQTVPELTPLYDHRSLNSGVVEYLDVGDNLRTYVSVGESVFVRHGLKFGWISGRYLVDSAGYRLSDNEQGTATYCSSCWITNRTWYTPAPTYFSTKAVIYGPAGVVKANADYYGVNLEGYIGGVAMMSPADIGQTVWLKPPGGKWEGPYKVVDSHQRNHVQYQVVELGQALEIDFETAVRWGMASKSGSGYNIIIGGLEGVQVWKGEMKPWLYGQPANYSEFFSKMVRYTSNPEQNWRWSPIFIDIP